MTFDVQPAVRPVYTGRRPHDAHVARPRAATPPSAMPSDSFVRGGASTRLGVADRERLATRLIGDMEKLTWAANPSEKLRLLATIADLRVDAVVPVVTREYAAGIATATSARQLAFAKVFYNLVPPAVQPGDRALSPAARDEAVAFMLKEFKARAGDIHHVLGCGLALAQTDAAVAAIIKDYQATPATGAMSLNKPLLVLGLCPVPQVVDFLTGEYERLSGNEAARIQVLETLQGVLK